MKINSVITLAVVIFLVQFVFLPISHGRMFLPMDADLIEQTCQQTPDHDLCVSSLKPDPRSSGADVKGLALIMVNVVKAKATDSVDRINELLQKSPGDQALKSCSQKYNAVIQADVPSAIQALKTGDPKFAEQGMNDAAIEANSCENDFSGSSPITDLNKAAHDVAAVAAAIVRLLL